MAYQQGNFNFQGQVPTAAIIQAYQNKAQMEQQAKMQEDQAKRGRLQDTLQTIQMASQLVQQGVNLSNQRQQKQAQQVYAATLAGGNDLVPTGQNMTVPSPKGFGLPGTTMNVQETGARKQYDPAYKMELLTSLQGIDPRMVQGTMAPELIKGMFKESEGVSAKDQALTEKYKAETAFLKSGKPVSIKTKSDVELMELAQRDALDEAKAANKYGEMADENFLIKVKQAADEKYEAYKAARDLKGKPGYIKVIDPKGVVGNVPISDWSKRKDQYREKGYQRVN